MKALKEDPAYNVGDYLWYLQNFDQFHQIPNAIKLKEHKRYRRYLLGLSKYLKMYYQKISPLEDFSIYQEQIQEDYEQRWKEGTIRGWNTKVDPNEIKQNPLYCPPCQKLFTNENSFVSHSTGKKHKKNVKKMKKRMVEQGLKTDEQDLSQVNKKNNDIMRDLTYLECFCMRMKEHLSDVIQDTCNNIRKKQSRTFQEMQAEHKTRVESDDGLSDSDDDERFFNPKKVPLGWDGKPIPYWLYKLHGLAIKYRCEICGDFTYHGRRAYEKHFQEWRHARGMKSLGIPNTVHFKEITSMNDALALFQKLRRDQVEFKFRPDKEEEFEDDEGNILNKKTYEDLHREGLI